jgi:membrane protein involved in colicin uptake
MKTLTDRKIAEQEQVTYKTQQMAEEARKELEQAKAMAATQARVVDSERSVAIAEFGARAAAATAKGQADAKTINAQADANVIETVGNAEAAKTEAVGTAEADVIKMKIASMESGNYAAVQIATALSTNHMKLVPDIMAGGGDQGGNLMNLLLAKMLQGTSGNGQKEE